MNCLHAVLLLGFAACSTAASGIRVTDLDGAVHRPLGPGDDSVHVLVFATADCPIANAYAPEVCAIVDKYASQSVRFYLVHVDPDVTVERARVHREEYGYEQITVIRDPEHRLVAATGVSITPEVAVFTSDGMVYRGRIDNWYGDLGRKRPAATRHELRDALDAIRASEVIARPRSDAVGCFIADFR